MKVLAGKGLPTRGVSGDIRPDAAASGAPAGGADDRVSVSSQARDLAALRAQLGPVDGVRAEKVASLRAVMAKGRYSADPPAVAEAVLRHVLADLLA
jgi:flagellar biosynthesis anti-sigma factor FlgM